MNIRAHPKPSAESSTFTQGAARIPRRSCRVFRVFTGMASMSASKRCQPKSRASPSGGNRVGDLNKIQSEAYRQVEEVRDMADAKPPKSTRGLTTSVLNRWRSMNSLLGPCSPTSTNPSLPKIRPLSFPLHVLSTPRTVILQVSEGYDSEWRPRSCPTFRRKPIRMRSATPALGFASRCEFRNDAARSAPLVANRMWTALYCDASLTIILWHIHAGSGHRPFLSRWLGGDAGAARRRSSPPSGWLDDCKQVSQFGRKGSRD
jgi:hypothetical protein